MIFVKMTYSSITSFFSLQLEKLHRQLEKQLPRRESMLKLVEKPRAESAATGKQLSRTDSNLSQVEVAGQQLSRTDSNLSQVEAAGQN